MLLQVLMELTLCYARLKYGISELGVYIDDPIHPAQINHDVVVPDR